MAANPVSVSVPDSGCFLCGRTGARRIVPSEADDSASGSPVFRYECPTCGSYEIRAVTPDDVALEASREIADDTESRDTSPVEIESAAIEHWSKALEVAERERRVSKKPHEPQVRHKDSGASACA